MKNVLKNALKPLLTILILSALCVLTLTVRCRIMPEEYYAGTSVSQTEETDEQCTCICEELKMHLLRYTSRAGTQPLRRLSQR